MSDTMTTPYPSTAEAATPAAEPATAPTLMDNYADGLMNELFGDVEHILETGLEPPTETVALPEPRQSSALMMPSALMAPPAQPLATQPDPSSDMVSIREELDQVRQQGRRLDVLLLGAALGSFVLTVGIWALNRHNLIANQQVTISPPPTAAELQAAADQEFLAYLSRSLDVIDRRSELQASSTGLANSGLPTLPTAPSALPGVVVPGALSTLPPTPSDTPGAIAPATPQAAPPSAPNPGGLPFQNFALRYGTPAVTPPAAPLSPVNPGVAANPPAATVTVPTAGNHKLIGVVQLGDESSALFEVDGSTQRIGIGEAIGVSGWSLVTVTNQEAIIRRNGEIRSIHLQQTF